MTPKSLDELESQLKAFFSQILLVKNVIGEMQNKSLPITRRRVELADQIIEGSLRRLIDCLNTFSDYHGVDIRSKALERHLEQMKYLRPVKMAGIQRRMKKIVKHIDVLWSDASEHCQKLDEILEGE
ncbi:MAG TPA: hypothetical protein DEV85_06175 [Vibrio sp.]|uniref:hypothetical protein n=1 Tax=Vibrio sp. TaxID=678 RepID=UPI000EC4E9C8|nr:hypothetical protein [Vibrio sp.]HCH01459.1 hypothetical protein [Vibrio sp.]